MKVILVSRTLDVLDPEATRSASQSFELGLARSLTEHATVEIISMQVCAPQQSQSLSLKSAPSTRSLVDHVRHALRQRPSGSHRPILIMFGYEARLLGVLTALSKVCGAQLVSFVFDNHVGALEYQRWLRRVALDAYFRLGFALLRYAAGIVILNDRARSRLPDNHVPVYTSRVGVDCSIHSALRSPPGSLPSERFRVVYAGSLEVFNGIRPLLRAFDQFDQRRFRLDIYGSGALADEVARFAVRSAAVSYHGVVDRSVLDRALQFADLAVCLRDTGHAVAAFSFPSKLVSYMAAGIPVLTTQITDDRSFADLVEVCPSLDVDAVSSAIHSASQRRDALAKKAVRAKDYVCTHHAWEAVARDMLHFFRSLSDPTRSA